MTTEAIRGKVQNYLDAIDDKKNQSHLYHFEK